jgi:hypothetical protein
MRSQEGSQEGSQDPTQLRLPDATSNGTPLSLVDDALRVACGRQLFTRDEALELLRQVESEVDDPARAARVERIVADADVASADQLMLNCADLVDPLLDIRLVLC